jgi:hypothetical protein
MSDVSKSYSELYSTVRNDAPKSAVTIRSKNWRGVKTVKHGTKKKFFTELKKTCETLEPVR